MGRSVQPEAPFVSLKGEMAQRLRDFDWGSTSLGPIAQWPQSLRTAAGIVLVSPVPIVMFWGQDGIMIYNDAYSTFAGDRHPKLLGSKVREGWPEVADFNDHVMKVGLSGGTLAYRDQQLTLYRSGVAEQVWMDLDYSPILDESGKPAGVMAIVVETTERARAEAARRHSEEQLRLATEAAEIGLWDTDHITGTSFWQPRVKAMFGISPEASVSRQDFYAGLHPEDREVIGAAVAAACDPSRRSFYDVEYRTVGKEDGEIRWVAAKGRGVFDQSGKCVRTIGSVIDITARKKIEQQLRTLNESLERQVEERTAERDRVWHHSRDLLGIARTDGIIRAVNPAWTEILGYTPDEVVGRSYLSFVFPEDADLAANAWQTALSEHGMTDFPIRLRHKDGSARWISWRSSTEGDLHYGYGRDITAAKAQEQALAEAERALLQAQKMEAVGLLTGGIAHDFNNLLQSVTGCLDLIRRRPDEPERVHRWAEAGLKAAHRGAKLTAQLLAFSRSQKLEHQQVNLSALLSAMRELLARTLGPAIRIQIDLGAHSAGVLCDQTQLEMAVLNLAINARDAMPNGGELRIATHECTIVHDPELPTGRYIELTVSDTGTGMSTEVAAKAFDPFFTTKGAGKGTGLGLSQVYGMARQAGGVARIQSMPQQGTTVRLLLPGHDKTRSAAAEREESDSPIASMQATVLVVDDDADVRLFLVETLQTFGYHVLEADDGYAGLSILARSSPHLAIVDYAMPSLTGVEMVRELRLKRPDLPILFASGYAETAEIEEALDENTSILRKPFEISKLQQIVSELLQRSQGKRV
jgi:PAS domain S-box-containing protein